MEYEELVTEINTLKKRVRVLEDIEEINKLQKAYGYYMQYWMAEDIIDLFSDDPDVSLYIAAGKYIGKEAIKRWFHNGKEDIEIRKSVDPEFLHQVMQLSGIIDIDPDGQTAKGRWYGFGASAFHDKGSINPAWMNGVYEVDYVKENGKWKFKKVHWCIIFLAPWLISFVDPSRRIDRIMEPPMELNPSLRPTAAPENTAYPSGYVCPFHFDNPVSGRKAPEA